MNNWTLSGNRAGMSRCAFALLLAWIIFLAPPATAFSQTAHEALKSIQSLSATICT